MTDLRQRKRFATRERLFDVALALFAERGYEATTVDQVAQGADVSRATAFNYFPRKEDFLLEWASRRRTETSARLAGYDDATAAEAIEAALAALASAYAKEAHAKALVRCWLQAGGPLLAESSSNVELFTTLIRRGQSAGELSQEADAAQVGRAVFNIYLGALYDWASGDLSGAWLRRELPGAVRLLLRGLQIP